MDYYLPGRTSPNQTVTYSYDDLTGGGSGVDSVHRTFCLMYGVDPNRLLTPIGCRPRGRSIWPRSSASAVRVTRC
ncbi:MAG TPA: hypothetical protein VK797_06075 [Tepidisphaeraceae bacterium]|nr:hypothetical protein [Tepidisphaeraceae bacterium]